MTDLNAPFAPDWVSPPGDTILDLIEERGWTQGELAKRLGYTEKHISQLINGKVPLTDEAALRLERVLGSSAGFWLAREAKYREHCARLEAARAQADWVHWLDELPVKAMMKNGAIATTRMNSKNKPALVDECLRFFGVASPDDWRTLYGGMQASFRRCRTEQSDLGAISAWLRMGEQQAEKLDGPKYDRARFEHALKDIAGLTREQPDVFIPQMRKWMQDAGVFMVLVPAIPRAHVSGVARWLNPTRPMIQLSLYGRTNDKFWFTFFHEAAHILLHAKNKEEKQSVFLDDPNANHAENQQEHEANQWASDQLIPPDHASNVLPNLRNKTDIEEFARSIKIHPGIVVGRLQHDGLIEHFRMNSLKQSFNFEEASYN